MRVITVGAIVCIILFSSIFIALFSGEPTEGILCPKCESNIVIELDPTQLEAAERGHQVQTPAGSLDTGALKLLATSSTPVTTAYKVTSAADQM